MEKDPLQRYAEGLNRTIQTNYHYLKGAVEEFQELCRLVSPEKNIPPAMIADIREMYKEIRNRLSEIRAVEQLLQGKYRPYYRRDPIRDKEILEFGFIVKNCFSKFEYTMMQIETLKRLKRQSSKAEQILGSFHWFCSKENQITLIKNLRTLKELDYESPPQTTLEDRRDLSGSRSITLFLFRGDPHSLDFLQSSIQLREHDIIERYAPEEIRGILTHLKKVPLNELENLFQRLLEIKDLPKPKCLLFSVQSLKDLERDFLKRIQTALEEMKEGEIKIF